jgi:hypothetical protein
MPNAQPSRYENWKDFLWPLGGTLLGLFAVPIAIAQYPSFFNENKYLFPLSAGAVIVCWLLPLVLHDRTRKWFRTIVAIRWGYLLAALIVVAIFAGLFYGGRALFRFHERHSELAIAAANQAVKGTLPPQPAAGAQNPPSKSSSPKPQSKPRISKGSPDAEVKRRYALLDHLRDQYILSNAAANPDLLAKKIYPPAEWINEKLKELGETWRFEDRDHPFRLNAYQAMTNQELQDATLKFVDSIHAWMEANPVPVPPPSLTSESMPQMLRSEEMYETSFLSKFLGGARALRKELEARGALPPQQTPKQYMKDSMAKGDLDSGMLTGPSHGASIADYLEELAQALPTK